MKTEKQKAVRFLAITLAILLLSSIFVWGFQTDWGRVEIRRMNLTNEDGTKLSTLLYLPKNATEETPAPLAIIYHGRSNQGHSNDTWSMELARRGYVVLSPDLTGGGESYTYSGGYFNGGRNTQGLAMINLAKNMKFVDQEHINLIGYSLGTNTVTGVADLDPESINSNLDVFGPFMVVRSLKSVKAQMEVYGIHTGIIKADCDQYDFSHIGDALACRTKVSEALELDHVIDANSETSFGDAVFVYTEISDAMHQTGNISGSAITAILQFENRFNSAPVALADNDQVWLWQQIFSGIACVDMMFCLAAALNLLMQTEFFGAMAVERKPRKELRGAKNWCIDILFTFVIPAALFITVSTWGMKWFSGSFLTSDNLNGIMLWLLVAMFGIGTVRTLIKHNKRKKAGEAIEAADYCLAAPGEKFNKSNAGKSLLLGVAVTAFFGLWMTAMEAYLGIDYQVWNLSTYLKPSGLRVIRAIPYMIIIFIVMFSGNINQRVLPSTGNEKKDMWIAVAVNTVLTASALFFLLLVQYGGSFLYGTGETFFKGNGGSTGALDFAFGYCYMMGGTTGVVTYFYRKYGNVLPAVVTCSIFAGLFTFLSMTTVV